jgi:hypothetical protein
VSKVLLHTCSYGPARLPCVHRETQVSRPMHSQTQLTCIPRRIRFEVMALTKKERYHRNGRSVWSPLRTPETSSANHPLNIPCPHPAFPSSQRVHLACPGEPRFPFVLNNLSVAVSLAGGVLSDNRWKSSNLADRDMTTY